jgi:Zn/Cd-binding protein ZinT
MILQHRYIYASYGTTLLNEQKNGKKGVKLYFKKKGVKKLEKPPAPIKW